MAPIFGFSLQELQDGKFQRELLDIYAPQLKDIPINKHMSLSETPNKHELIEKILKLDRNSLHIFQYLQLKLCFAQQKKSLKNISFPKDIKLNGFLNIPKLIYCSGKDTSARMRHILRVIEYMNQM